MLESANLMGSDEWLKVNMDTSSAQVHPQTGLKQQSLNTGGTVSAAGTSFAKLQRVTDSSAMDSHEMHKLDGMSAIKSIHELQ